MIICARQILNMSWLLAKNHNLNFSWQSMALVKVEMQSYGALWGSCNADLWEFQTGFIRPRDAGPLLTSTTGLWIILVFFWFDYFFKLQFHPHVIPDLLPTRGCRTWNSRAVSTSVVSRSGSNIVQSSWRSSIPWRCFFCFRSIRLSACDVWFNHWIQISSQFLKSRVYEKWFSFGLYVRSYTETTL